MVMINKENSKCSQCFKLVSEKETDACENCNKNFCTKCLTYYGENSEMTFCSKCEKE